MQEELDRRRREPLTSFSDIDRALEWCENRLIGVKSGNEGTAEAMRLVEHPLCQGLSQEAVRALEKLLEARRFERGSLLVSRGDSSRDFFFLLRGEVSVGVTLADGQYRRLATLGPGMGFGELSVMGGGERSADVRADGVVDCLVLGCEAFEQLGRVAPEAKIVLLENMLRNAAATVNRLTREVTALAG
jgi:CRP-like cAMP-binding protein